MHLNVSVKGIIYDYSFFANAKVGKNVAFPLETIKSRTHNFLNAISFVYETIVLLTKFNFHIRQLLRKQRLTLRDIDLTVAC